MPSNLGREAVADLNQKEGAADKGRQRNKFLRGHGLYWQCTCCGEDHEESIKKCNSGTCRIMLEDGSWNGA